ncbi:hypothetical protein TGAM01_v201731 [Trichoderma gamsii]|uniref:DUF7924 domain-containing protein n=1 Tax=Trichoderma gamsii TaxID=398673 RepID=A0A2P4ZYV6_9HYPO|nr:hypothetical protein TGAM01_v201731 [Trichoderma gamsii]PON29482.1 hypothetical protein TGAM01_v201731 [Trichoderma gamsii]
MDPMPEQPRQSQEQGVEILREYHPYPSRPLSPIIEESSAELPHNRKRVREGEVALYETSEDDREWKRQQMLDSHDTAETAATEANTASEETNHVDGSHDEAEPLEAEYEEASHEEAGHEEADNEGTDVLESVEEAATQIATPLWNYYAVVDSDDEDVEDEDILHSGSAYQSTSASPSPPSEFDRTPSMTPAPEANASLFVLPKDRWPAEPKSAQYRDALWSIVYNKNKTFMWEFHEGLAEGSLGLCKELLGREQLPPRVSVFDDDVIHEISVRCQRRNETRVFRDITPLIAPSAELVALRGNKELDILCESANEIWTYSQQLLQYQPQPSYSVGFKALAFTELQFTKVTEFFEDRCTSETSPIMGTSHMFFPCFSCEIGSFEITRRQNTHNMTIGMRAVVDLFRGVKRESDVHRQILAFSISHDSCEAEIVAHYPVILGETTEFYQQIIASFVFTDSRFDKWMAYRFTKNMYEVWMPAQFQWICSAIDQLPEGWSCGKDIGQREFV